MKLIWIEAVNENRLVHYILPGSCREKVRARKKSHMVHSSASVFLAFANPVIPMI
jgi:hypothetical protein